MVRPRPLPELTLRLAAATSGANPDEVLAYYRTCLEATDSSKSAALATAEHFGLDIHSATNDIMAQQVRFYANYPAALEFLEPHRITEETEP